MLRLKHLVIFNFLLILYLYCLHFNNKKIEKLTNTDHIHEIDITKIQQVIQERYEIDIEAIRNLSSISKSLQVGGLIIPGNVSIKGNINVDGSMNYLPKGSIIAFNGPIAPKGWAICDGKNGTPDLRNRFILGSGKNIVGKTGGEENVKLTTKEMPSHNHSLTINNSGNHQHGGIVFNGGTGGHGFAPASFYNGGNSMGWAGDHSHKHTMGNTGSGVGHENMPPYYVLTYVMKL